MGMENLEKKKLDFGRSKQDVSLRLERDLTAKRTKLGTRNTRYITYHGVC